LPSAWKYFAEFVTQENQDDFSDMIVNNTYKVALDWYESLEDLDPNERIHLLKDFGSAGHSLLVN